MTSYKAILLHVDAEREQSPALDVAIGLGRRFEAALTGLVTSRELAMMKLLLGAEHRAVRDFEARLAPLVAATRNRFMGACTRAGIEASLEEGEGNAAELLAFVGRVQDLIVVEQSTSGLDGLGTDLVEECAIVAGVPTLIVPRSGSAAEIGKCIAIGWNHSRQAAVALRGALPLICRAERVVVLAGHERDPMPSVTKRPRADIRSYIARYSPNVEVRPIPSEASGAGLQAAAIASGADMLVMGAYGRSVWREFIFGGTTREVMAELRLPVLTGH
jgi:nucleotide-binding universal stress UspA family protein